MRKILYKYRQWNDFTKAIFSEHKIYCPSPPQLNDPFDCKAGLYSHQTELSTFLMNIHLTSFTLFYLLPNSKKISEKKKNIQKFFNSHKNNTKANFEYIQKFLLTKNPYLPKLSTGKEYVDLFEHQANKLGVFSLTEDPANMLMWSHYGDQHQGIAIGFEQINNNDLGNTDKCKPVNYGNLFPIADFSELQQELSYSSDEKNKFEKKNKFQY